MTKFITTLLLTLIIATNAAASVTSAYTMVHTGDPVKQVVKKIGNPDTGPNPYTSPIGTIYCMGWVTPKIVVCVNGKMRVVWVGQSNSKNELVAQKGNKKLFLKMARPKKPVDLRLTA